MNIFVGHCKVGFFSAIFWSKWVQGGLIPLCQVISSFYLSIFVKRQFSGVYGFLAIFFKIGSQRNLSKLILQNFAAVASEGEFKWAPEVERGWRVFNVENVK